MRYILITLLCCLMSSFSFAGRVDFNAVNFGQYADYQSLVWLIEMVNVSDTIGIRLRVDKTQANYLDEEDIDRVIELDSMTKSQEFSWKDVFVEVTFTANLWATPEINLAGLKRLKQKSVNCEKTELGNEWYSITKDLTGKISWSYYIAIAQPIVTLFETSYPDMKFVFPACPNPSDGLMGGGRKDHKDWNDALSLYVSTKSSRYGIVWHTYYNGNTWSDFKKYEKGLPKIVYNPSVFVDTLDKIFTEMVDTIFASPLFLNVRSYCNTKFAGRYIDMTEYGIDNSGVYRNTLAYSSVIFKDLIANRQQFRAMYLHACCSLVGAIKPRKDYEPDSISSLNIRTTEYWALKLANEVPYNTPIAQTTNNIIQAGTYYYYYNLSENDREFNITIPSNLRIESLQNSYIWGAYLYWSSGQADYMARGTVDNFSISGITRGSDFDLLANSFGYIKVVIEDIPIVSGCTDYTALNYNPLANQNDGSCYYQYDCDCKIVSATNYNADAPCENNSVCKCQRRFFGLFNISVKCRSSNLKTKTNG